MGRLSDLIFQGYQPKSYLRSASKVLIAGAVGISIGWVMQPFFTAVLGWPYWLSYWPAVLCGYVGNLRTQAKLGNLKMEKKDELSNHPKI